MTSLFPREIVSGLTVCRSEFVCVQGVLLFRARTTLSLPRYLSPRSQLFFVMFLFTASRNGVAAKEVQRQIGVLTVQEDLKENNLA